MTLPIQPGMDKPAKLIVASASLRGETGAQQQAYPVPALIHRLANSPGPGPGPPAWRFASCPPPARSEFPAFHRAEPGRTDPIRRQASFSRFRSFWFHEKYLSLQRARATQRTPARMMPAPARRGASRPSPNQRLPMVAENTMESSRPATT